MTHSLLYFNAPGRAWVARICFKKAGIALENKYINSFQELIAARGPEGRNAAVPLGSVPVCLPKPHNPPPPCAGTMEGLRSSHPHARWQVLTLPSGKVVCQSLGIAQYAAKKAGLYPRDDDEKALLIDEVVLSAYEMQDKVPQDPDTEVKKAKRAAFVKDTMPKYMDLLRDR